MQSFDSRSTDNRMALNEETQGLALRTLTKARQIAEQYARVYREHRDEIRSAAEFGLTQAADTFDPMNERACWDMWSTTYIHGEIRHWLKSHRAEYAGSQW